MISRTSPIIYCSIVTYINLHRHNGDVVIVRSLFFRGQNFLCRPPLILRYRYVNNNDIIMVIYTAFATLYGGLWLTRRTHTLINSTNKFMAFCEAVSKEDTAPTNQF